LHRPPEITNEEMKGSEDLGLAAALGGRLIGVIS